MSGYGFIPFRKCLSTRLVVSTGTEMLVGNTRLKTAYRILVHLQRTKATAHQQYVNNFDEFLPAILDKISTRRFGKPEVADNIRRITEFSANKDNKLRGNVTLLSYNLLGRPQNLSQDLLKDIGSLAWGAELVDTYAIILDNLERRPGKTCWHTYDTSLLRSFIYEMLQADFINKPYYVDLVHLFNQAFLHTTVGSYLDITSKYRNNDNFTMDRYQAIVEHKTSYPIFKFPVALASTVTENGNKAAFTQTMDTVDSVCSDLGQLHHMRNDFLDCYGAETDHMGIPKHSQQIQDGTCTWLAVTALQRLTPSQKIVFSSCYGSKQPAHIERLKLLYDQLQMKKLYKEEEGRIYSRIESKAKNLGDCGKFVMEVLGLIRSQ